MNALRSNLSAGWRLATFQGVSLDDFHLGNAGAVGSTAVALGTWWFGAWLLGAVAGAPFRTNLLFFGAAHFAVVFAACGILPAFFPIRDLPEKLAVVLLSVAPLTCFAAVVASLERALTGGPWLAASALAAAWMAAAHFRGLKVVTGLGTTKVIPAFAFYLGLGLVPPVTFSLL